MSNVQRLRKANIHEHVAAICGEPEQLPGNRMRSVLVRYFWDCCYRAARWGDPFGTRRS